VECRIHRYHHPVAKRQFGHVGAAITQTNRLTIAVGSIVVVDQNIRIGQTDRHRSVLRPLADAGTILVVQNPACIGADTGCVSRGFSAGSVNGTVVINETPDLQNTIHKEQENWQNHGEFNQGLAKFAVSAEFFFDVRRYLDHSGP
jgi:hypothetical protein